jgi:hypothetical protein
MSVIKALIAGLAQNPTGLRAFVEDPQALVQLAGLGEAECTAIGGALRLASNLRNSLSGARRTAPPRAFANARYVVSTRGGGTMAGQQGTAITGVVGLLAVAGAVVAVGTVSMVALSRRDE